MGITDITSKLPGMGPGGNTNIIYVIIGFAVLAV